MREKYRRAFSSSLRLKSCLKYIDMILDFPEKTLFFATDLNKYNKLKQEKNVLQKCFENFSIELLRISNFQNSSKLKKEIEEVLGGEVLICKK